MRKTDDGFLDLKNIDPAVEELLGQGRKKQNERALPKATRAKKRKAEAKQEARKGRQALYDLDQDVKDGVSGLAEELGTTASQVANVLLAEALRAVRMGVINLQHKRVPSRSPRYEFTLKRE